jgi:hypothetical protein
MKGNRWIVLASAGVALAAAQEQLSRPPNERTWYGRIAGVPYDFRIPTAESIRAKVWDKNNPSLLAPTLFGVGWSINLYRLAHPKAS